ncbi:TetR/AcrR family transcriptional regulator [Antrihabitans stalactiti]|uniref:TetR/AcrR family transcriptional regulator n=1 Tax=Antrihabitans stalactiti TaxID=2584121 RepID=A0A848K5R6_9NOCA|nr:TetR/AcrR family transcriptional regulator [Antrihabitans stalactiti]NMN93739.1 TetR/AcrR family transcriptional regulator [Antrihabitans stalactiti]
MTTTRTRWGDRETRRHDILRAGRTLLLSKGLAALQMREVARGAGIALGTVYTYFPNKEALFAAMYADRLDAMLSELAPALDTTTNAEDLFVHVASAYREVYTEFGKDVDLVAMLGNNELDTSVRDRLVQSAGRLLAAFRVIVERTGVAEADLALTVMWSSIVGLCDHFTGVRHQLHQHTWDEAVRFTARTFARGLAPEGKSE